MRAAIKFFGFWLSFSIAFLVANSLALAGYSSPFPEDPSPATGALLMVVTLCYAAVFAVITARASWRGVKLIAALWWAFFGIAGLLTQVESLLFLQRLIPVLTTEFVLRLLLQTAIAGILGSLLAVLFYGKRGTSAPPSPGLTMTPAGWVMRLALSGAVYFAIYWSFGFFVAVPLGGEAFAQFYAGLHLPAWFPVFQMARGVVWASTAIPILMLWTGPRWQAGLLVALMFPVFMGVIMIVPNPIFPDQLRMAHLVELLGSNFLNGWAVYGILSWKARQGSAQKFEGSQVGR